MKICQSMSALVTGGSSGMGLEYARQLAGRGCRLLLVSNQEKALEEARTDLSARYGVEVLTHCMDLALSSSADELFAFCRERAFMPDLLVLNAGMFFFKELSLPDDRRRVDAMLELHVSTPTRLCLLFGEEMKRRGSGAVLLVSSVTAKLPTPGITLYAATKAYLRSFGKSMWFEYRPYGVDVTTVCPAAIDTPLYGIKPGLMRAGLALGLVHKSEWLVRRALRGVEKRHRVVAPGLMNLLLPALVRLLPAGIENRLWQRFK